MSELDDFMRQSHAEAAGVIGEVPFVVDGKKFCGILDELGDQGYTIIEGGKEFHVSAHLLCQLPQFAGAPPTSGTRLKISGRLLVIANFTADSSAITFTLADPDAK